MTKKHGFIKGAIVSTLLTGVLICAPGNSEAVQSYQVQAGDSLWKIANKFNMSISQLKDYNNLTSDEIWVGQSLLLEPAAGNNNYTVKPGDSLYLIAKAQGITVSQLKTANQLISDEIWVGQKLIIPQPAANSRSQYTVVPGDSLYLIAQRHGTTVDKLISVNGLTGDMIYVGQVLTLPTDNNTTPAPDVPQSGTWQIPSGVTLHYVQSGDSLSSIAHKYNSTVDAVMKTNRLKNDLITPGMPLFVPVNSTQPASISAPQGAKRAGYGELLNWEYANWLFNHGSTAVIKDLQTGVTFNVSRIGGGNHADCEPLTAQDTAVMKSLYGGSWSWQVRPVLLIYQGREIAASMAGMPHGFDTIANNDFYGMFDLHFLGSRTHNTNAEDPQHQQAVLRAAGR